MSKAKDSKFFSTQKKGEIAEMKEGLMSNDKTKVKDAVKKVIAAMTVGKDVSSLFTDIIQGMQTNDLELKKLIYLYITNYARVQPEKAILVVNTFQKDAMDVSPLVRALAIRTMGCIRVDRITEYLCEPLMTALKDKDPYVRKTAAVCVAKLYDINAELVEEQQFLDKLRDMLGDPNPMVVANAVAALSEISESSGVDQFHINSATLQKLLAALNECTEWGQVFLLDALAQYEPNSKDAEMIIERVIPRLQHVNSAVSMSAVKVIMKYLDYAKDKELIEKVIKTKLPPPLITLLSEQKPEIQYVALRNINLIVRKQPAILQNEVKHFFCKYNDPIYVKLEKLEVMYQLASEANIAEVLMEFKEYAQEVDIEFVRKAVRSIGRCAIKIEAAAERCIKVLLELIQTKVSYVVQEAVVVIKDIFRKYPERYESIISDLCENLESLDEPEAKASMVWILGEYSGRIENSPELLEGFIDTFADEPTVVQLQLLTAVVKLFLRRPEDGKDMVTRVLKLATDHSDNPDLRDRGFVYWRLLASDPAAAQTIVLAEKPVISAEDFAFDPSLLKRLISNIATLSSVFHKPPESFAKGSKAVILKGVEEKESENESESEEESDEDEDEEEEEEEETKTAPTSNTNNNNVIDILGDVFAPAMTTAPTPSIARKIVLPASKGQGLQISSALNSRDNSLFMELLLQNQSSTPITQFAAKFNANFWNITPKQVKVPLPGGQLMPGSQCEISLELNNPNTIDESKKLDIQIAVKTDLGVFYFVEKVAAPALLEADGKMDKGAFLSQWKTFSEENSAKKDLVSQISDPATVKSILTQHHFFEVAAREYDNKHVAFMSGKLRGIQVLAELSVSFDNVKVLVKSSNPKISEAVMEGIAGLL